MLSPDLEQMHRPNNPEFAPGSERLTMLEQIPIVRAGWGTYIATEDRIRAYEQEGVPEDVLESIQNLGFTGGFHSTPDTIVKSREFQKLHEEYLYRLVYTVAAKRNWDTVDRFFVGSSTVQREVIGTVIERLGQKGIHVRGNSLTQGACGGQVINDTVALQTEALQGKNIVSVGMDSLSGDMTDRTNPVTEATFGNGAVAYAYQPGIDMVLKKRGKTVFRFDSKRNFGIPHGYNEPKTNPPINPEEFERQFPGFVIEGDETMHYLQATDDLLALWVPDEGEFYMVGSGMPRLFSIGDVPSLVVDRLESHRNDNPTKGRDFDDMGIFLGHNPSSGVAYVLNRNIALLLLKDRNLSTDDRRRIKESPEQCAQVLDENGINSRAVQNPWVLSRTPFNNVSAGTTGIVMEQLAHEQQIEPDISHIRLGLGVGINYQVDEISFPKTT